MRNLSEFGAVKASTGERYTDAQKMGMAIQNSAAFIAAQAKGEGVEITGAYFIMPLEFSEPCVPLRGDGPLVAKLILPPGINKPILDLTNVQYFRTTIEGISFWGYRNDALFMLGLSSGGYHYAVTLRDVIVRGNGGDGIFLANHRLPKLDNVAVFDCAGTGVVMRNCVGALATLDVEGCHTGIAIEGSKRRKDVATTIWPYTENIEDIGLIIHNATGVTVMHPGTPIRFTGEHCHHNVVNGGYPIRVEFKDGAHRNSVYVDERGRTDELGNYYGERPETTKRGSGDVSGPTEAITQEGSE